MPTNSGGDAGLSNRWSKISLFYILIGTMIAALFLHYGLPPQAPKLELMLGLKFQYGLTEVHAYGILALASSNLFVFVLALIAPRSKRQSKRQSAGAAGKQRELDELQHLLQNEVNLPPPSTEGLLKATQVLSVPVDPATSVDSALGTLEATQPVELVPQVPSAVDASALLAPTTESSLQSSLKVGGNKPAFGVGTPLPPKINTPVKVAPAQHPFPNVSCISCSETLAQDERWGECSSCSGFMHEVCHSSCEVCPRCNARLS